MSSKDTSKYAADGYNGPKPPEEFVKVVEKIIKELKEEKKLK